MAGYDGYSMSNNAVLAYDTGEKPISNWTKAVILSEIQEQIQDGYADDIELDFELVNKLTKDELVNIFLHKSSWHHTSSTYNKTNFYEVRINEDTNNQVINDFIAKREANRTIKQEKVEPTLYYANVEYGEWVGSFKNPKLVEFKAQAIIKENVAYLLPNGKRKMIYGKHFHILSKTSRKPKEFDSQKVSEIKKQITPPQKKQSVLKQLKETPSKAKQVNTKKPKDKER